jgi:BirA family biotin operon repressor/biotin-[acetyl-CoA-carboxylase] ligase
LKHSKTAFWENVLFLKRAIGSTNIFLKGLAQEGAVEGTVVIADEQSAGLGTLGPAVVFKKRRKSSFLGFAAAQICPRQKIFVLTMIFALAGIDAIAGNLSGVNDID